MQPYPYPFIPWIWRESAGMGQTSDPSEDDATALRDRPDTGLLGYEVEAVDGRIGEVDQANAEVPADCLLIDTGTWLTSHRVVVPIGAVDRVDHEARRIHVDRTKNQVKDAPPYDADTFDADDYRQRLADYYTESYRSEPVE
jgi:hypothetical protein